LFLESDREDRLLVWQTLRLVGVLCLGGSMLACGSPLEPSLVAEGQWGGDHVAATVTAAGAHFEFDCASADSSQPLTLDERQRFTVPGRFVPEHPSVVEGQVEDAHPSTIAGTVMADQMTLTIRLTDTGNTIGPLTLERGVSSRLSKCL
jgi:hypothetical protein